MMYYYFTDREEDLTGECVERSKYIFLIGTPVLHNNSQLVQDHELAGTKLNLGNVVILVNSW